MRTFSSFHSRAVSLYLVSTITPRPQAGNPRPRVFRVSEQQALINTYAWKKANQKELRKYAASGREIQTAKTGAMR